MIQEFLNFITIPKGYTAEQKAAKLGFMEQVFTREMHDREAVRNIPAGEIPLGQGRRLVVGPEGNGVYVNDVTGKNFEMSGAGRGLFFVETLAIRCSENNPDCFQNDGGFCAMASSTHKDNKGVASPTTLRMFFWTQGESPVADERPCDPCSFPFRALRG